MKLSRERGCKTHLFAKYGFWVIFGCILEGILASELHQFVNVTHFVDPVMQNRGSKMELCFLVVFRVEVEVSS